MTMIPLNCCDKILCTLICLLALSIKHCVNVSNLAVNMKSHPQCKWSWLNPSGTGDVLTSLQVFLYHSSQNIISNVHEGVGRDDS